MSETHGEYAGAWSGRGTLSKLVEELDRQLKSRIDFVAGGLNVGAMAWRDGIRLARRTSEYGKDISVGIRDFIPTEGIPLSASALKQWGGRLNPAIPGRFLEDLSREVPSAAAGLINEILHTHRHEESSSIPKKKRFLFRCLDDRVRAIMSDSYRIMDNYDLAITALEVVREMKGEVIEASLSETHMRLKFTTRKIWDEIDVTRKADKGRWYAGGIGDAKYLAKVGASSRHALPGGPGTIHPLVTVSNSETGHGGLNVRIGILCAICYNLATVENVVSRIHLGERLAEGIFSRSTMSKHSEAIMSMASDGVRAAFDREKFKVLISHARTAQGDEILIPSNAVDNLVKNSSLTDDARDSILEHFLRDYDSTRYGLAQAVSRYSQEIEHSDYAADIEGVCGKLIKSGELIKA